jgi:hypothetical protein
MWLQMGAQQYDHAITHGTVKRFPVPVPWRGQVPKVIARYMLSTWRHDDMTLLEFLRRTNDKGGIHRALEARYNNLKKDNHPSVRDKSLQRWAQTVPMRGEVMVAARCNSRFNDAYYGQWLLLNVPFRNVENDLQLAYVDKLVPEGYRLFAKALLHAPSFWRMVTSVAVLSRRACGRPF